MSAPRARVNGGIANRNLVFLILLVGVFVTCCGSNPVALDAALDRGKSTADGAADHGKGDSRTADLRAGDGTLPCTASLGQGTLSGSVNGRPLTASLAEARTTTQGGERVFSIRLWNLSSATCGSVVGPVGGTPELSITLCSQNPGTYAHGSSCAGTTTKNAIDLVVQGAPPSIQPAAIQPAASGTITMHVQSDKENMLR